MPACLIDYTTAELGAALSTWKQAKRQSDFTWGSQQPSPWKEPHLAPQPAAVAGRAPAWVPATHAITSPCPGAGDGECGMAGTVLGCCRVRGAPRVLRSVPAREAGPWQHPGVSPAWQPLLRLPREPDQQHQRERQPGSAPFQLPQPYIQLLVNIFVQLLCWGYKQAQKSRCRTVNASVGSGSVSESATLNSSLQLGAPIEHVTPLSW